MALIFAFPAEAKPPAVLHFETAEFIYSNQTSIPTSGWASQRLPFHDFFEAETPANISRKTLWARLRFDQSAVASGASAMMIDYTTERFIVYLNGREVYRNYSDPTAQSFASFQPAFVPLPNDMIKSGTNQIDIRLETGVVWCLGIGHVSLGNEATIRDAYERSNFAQFLGPQIVNGIVLAMTLAALAFWLGRRKEHGFGWLALLGGVWWLRNLHYSAVNPPVGAHAMWEIATVSIFILCFAFFGFSVSVLDVPSRRRWINVSLLCCVFMICSRYALLAFGMPDLLSYVLLLPFSAMLIFILVRAVILQPTPDRMIMLGAIIFAVAASNHDFAFLAQGIKGAGFQIQPYSSVIIFGAFWFILGRRFFTLLDTVETMNVSLEDRVAVAGKQLMVVEAERRDLEVTLAVEAERERMMLEMHDRIGSGLVSALAVAERRGYPSDTVATLKNSLLDLRLAVDSLEPIEGDLALLLASFRHRVEPDLNSAGLSFDWHVEAVPALDWLNPVNALHVLRILQEAVANILSHADAKEIMVACRAQSRGKVDGVEITVADNGIGFDLDQKREGKGLSSMASRAASIGGHFAVEPTQGTSTRITLWLPQVRTKNALAHSLADAGQG